MLPPEPAVRRAKLRQTDRSPPRGREREQRFHYLGRYGGRGLLEWLGDDTGGYWRRP